MNMPGFTAEMSLYNRNKYYRLAGEQAGGDHREREIRPQIPLSVITTYYGSIGDCETGRPDNPGIDRQAYCEDEYNTCLAMAADSFDACLCRNQFVVCRGQGPLRPCR